MTMAKAARLVIRLDEADRDWIRAEAERIGVDSAALVRILVRQARASGSIDPNAGTPGCEARMAETPYQQEVPHSDHDEPAEDLDALMAAEAQVARELLHEPMHHNVPVRTVDDLGQRNRYRRPPQASPSPRLRANIGAFGAGSMTRPIGINDDLAGGYANGDGRGNVQRDNFRHAAAKGGLFASIRTR
jgi:transposase-like protein